MIKPDQKSEEDSLKVDENIKKELEKKEETTEEDSLKVDENIKKELEKKEETTEEKLEIVEEKLLRTLAEVENQRRRFEKERQEAFDFGGFHFAKESLSLLDNIERAIVSFQNDPQLKQDAGLDKIIEGIEIVKKDLVSIFKKNGIEIIECLNKKFNPNYHQAMLEVEDDTADPGIVLQEIQKGYMMKDRLLRPSLVGVSKKKQEKVEKMAKDEVKK